MNRTCRYSTFIFQSPRFDWEDLWVKLWPWTLVRAFSVSTNQKNPFMLCLFMMRLLLLHIWVTVMKAVRGFFFSSLKHCLSSSKGLPCCQRWDTLHCLIRRSQTLRSGDRPPKKILSLCLFRVSRIGAWLVQVADRRLSAVVLREVECVQVERLITRHLRPFSTSPFTMQPATSGVLANQKWAGSSGATAATVPVMAAHLAGSARPAVCLF